ncbi:CLUMA_CG009454, isoform A [Clunio marinus]|uniref:CLUMA_CG009454, isoform A n=1 Tax=Clunio marinus TaxID=568069 RepID=A0A1J1IAM4_9DIPT|nr:CLUMA_CG009454, isoform A [Clunio marinus]
MSNFVIFEDQENVHEKGLGAVGGAKKERQKLMPLGNKAINNENAFENQGKKIQKASESSSTIISGTYIQKNVFVTKEDQKIKASVKVEEVACEEESIINVTSDEWSTDNLEASSFSYRTTKDIHAKDEIATPMSIIEPSTPMSIDKSVLGGNLSHKSIIRNDRDRFFEVYEYQKDILEYLKQVESQKNIRPRAEYMKKQPDINDSMRAILVDWLVEVSEEYRLQSETLCLAVNYIDRFLSYMSVVRAKLQLVGTAAMFIASKYEEIYPPEIGEFVYITDDTYTKQQVLRMEKLLLKVLSFDLCAPSALAFINLYSSMINIPDKVKFLAQYLCELSLLRALPFLNYTPSRLSAAALAMAYHTFGFPIWNKKMRDTFGYEIEELTEIIAHLSEIHVEAESMTQQAIQEKYKAGKYLQVSSVKAKQILNEELNEIIAKLDENDDLNSTAENIENVRQKTEMLFN